MSTVHCVVVPFSDQGMANKAANEVANQLGYTCRVGILDYDAVVTGAPSTDSLPPTIDKFIQDALDLPADIQKRLYKCLYAAGNRI